ATKMSAASVANMNPDETRRIYEDAISQQGLKDDQAVSLVTAIREARDNPQMNALIKPEARIMHDKILARYGDRVDQLSSNANQTQATNSAATSDSSPQQRQSSPDRPVRP